MAGFQQAANALTGAIGTVGSRVGIYNELVGKNKEQREQLAKQNEELEKKNKEISDAYTALQETRSDAQLELDALHQNEWEKKMARQERREAKIEYQKIIDRRASIIDREWERNASHMSKNMMLNALYSDSDLFSGSGGGI